MPESRTDGTLLVPIANPETVDRLLDTAIDIARARGTSITAVHVVEVPPQIPLSSGDQVVSKETEQLLDYVAERGADVDVEVETKTRFARDTATGIVGSVEAYDGAAILMGWRGRPRRRDIVLGSFLDRILGESPCDVYVKRIRLPSPSIDSLLVPVAGGPHDELATELAAELAGQHDAEIVLFHVEHPDASDETQAEHERLLQERRELIPADLSVTTKTVQSEHTSGAITDESTSHDLTILGTTRDPFLQRKLVGSVAQGVGRTASGSVIITRKDTASE